MKSTNKFCKNCRKHFNKLCKVQYNDLKQFFRVNIAETMTS